MSVRKKEKLLRTSRRDCSRDEVRQRRRGERRRTKMALENVRKNTELAVDFQLPDEWRPWYYRDRYAYNSGFVLRMLASFVGRPWVEVHQYICANFRPENRHCFFDNVDSFEEANARGWYYGFSITEDGYLQRRGPSKRRRIFPRRNDHQRTLALAGWLNGRKVRRIGAATYFFMEATHENVVSFVIGGDIQWSIDYTVGYRAMIQKFSFRQGKRMTEAEVNYFLSFPEHLQAKAMAPSYL